MFKRWAILGAVVAAIGAAAWLALPESSDNAAVDRKAAKAGIINYSLPDLAGTMHSLPQGEVVLLNFWATWCPPCRKEMPSMQKLHEKLADRGLKVVAISVDRDKADIEKFVKETGITFQILHDVSSRVSQEYGVFRYPETFIIDRQGNVRYKLVGAVEWLSDSIVQKIEGLLNESGEQPAG